MEWQKLKAALLETGTTQLSGEPAEEFLGRSTAGPSAGGEGSVFFSVRGKRVRLAVSCDSPVEIVHEGKGKALLHIGDRSVPGQLETVGLHCPRQAYITISETCIHRCRYCRVPQSGKRTKTPEEVLALIRSVRDRIDAISLTSGVADSWEAEEGRVLRILRRLGDVRTPIGVSIYPGLQTPERLHAAGAAEVKFNIETATGHLFAEMCPGLDWDLIWRVLDRSVEVFGKGRVFSNLIIGLGETDSELASAIERLAGMGVVPVLRPLTPAAGVAAYPRPSAQRLLAILGIHERAMKRAGLSPGKALSMCTLCTGCDLVPGRDT